MLSFGGALYYMSTFFCDCVRFSASSILVIRLARFALINDEYSCDVVSDFLV